MANNSYKQAMNQARADSTTAVLQARSAYDRLNAKKANGTATSADTDKTNEAFRNCYKAMQNYNSAALQYRIDSDKQMLPSGTGEDKIKEAIYNDPKVQGILELGQGLNDKAANIGSSSRAMSFDQAYGNVSQNSSTAGGNIFTSAASGVSNAVNGAVSGVNNAVSGAVNGAVSGVNNAINGVVSGVSNTINNAVNTVTGLKDTISNMVSNTVGAVVNTADKLANMAGNIKDKISGMFSSDSSKNNQTKALADAKANKGQKETATKVTEISPNQHAAMQQSVAVVTKPVTEVTTNTKSAPVDQKKEELPSTGPLSKVGEKIKEATGAAASMTDAVKSVTNEISSNLKKATLVIDEVKSKVAESVNSVKSVVSDTVGAVTSTVKGAIDTVKTAANEVVGTAAGLVSNVTQGITSFTNPIVGTITDTIAAGKGLTDELAKSLPGPLGKFVSAKNTEFFNNLTNKVMNNKLMKVNTVLNSLNGLATSDKLTDAVGSALLAQLGKKYAKVTDSSGLSLSSIFGDNDKDVISKYYDQLTKLCPNIVRSNDIVDFGNNKTLFDALLNLLSDSGASDLLKQLLNCPASNNLYFDDSSIKVLQEAAITARKNGDVSTYYTILEKLGKKNMPNIKEDLIVLNANNDKDKAVETATVYRDTCSRGGITFSDLLSCQPASNVSSVVATTRRSAPTKMYDGPLVHLSCASNTYITDQIMGSDMRKLVQASIYLNR